MSIGYQLKELRIKKGMSQQEVAERLLITRQSISKWELDKGIPDLDMLKKWQSCLIFRLMSWCD